MRIVDEGLTPGADRSRADTQAPGYGSERQRKFFAGAYGSMVACYAVMMAAFTLVFLHSGVALFNVAIGILYGLMYFGLPVVLTRVARTRDLRFRPAEERHPDLIPIATGAVRPSVAFAQMLLIPAALARSGTMLWRAVPPGTSRRALRNIRTRSCQKAIPIER